MAERRERHAERSILAQIGRDVKGTERVGMALLLSCIVLMAWGLWVEPEMAVWALLAVVGGLALIGRRRR